MDKPQPIMIFFSHFLVVFIPRICVMSANKLKKKHQLTPCSYNEVRFSELFSTYFILFILLVYPKRQTSFSLHFNMSLL